MSERKGHFTKVFRHTFIALVLLISSIFVPSVIANSWVVTDGVEGALTWLEPEKASVDTSGTLTGVLRNLADRASSSVQGGAYSITRATTTALARFLVWAMIFVGLIFWALIEIRRALAHVADGLLSLLRSIRFFQKKEWEPKRLIE